MKPIVFRLAGANDASRLEASILVSYPEYDADHKRLVLACNASTDAVLGKGRDKVVYKGLLSSMTLLGTITVSCSKVTFVEPVGPVSLSGLTSFLLTVPLSRPSAWYMACSSGNLDFLLDIRASLSGVGQLPGKVSFISGFGCLTLEEPDWLRLRGQILAAQPQPKLHSTSPWSNLSTLVVNAMEHVQQGYVDTSIAECRAALHLLTRTMGSSNRVIDSDGNPMVLDRLGRLIALTETLSASIEQAALSPSPTRDEGLLWTHIVLSLIGYAVRTGTPQSSESPIKMQ